MLIGRRMYTFVKYSTHTTYIIMHSSRNSNKVNTPMFSAPGPGNGASEVPQALLVVAAPHPTTPPSPLQPKGVTFLTPSTETPFLNSWACKAPYVTVLPNLSFQQTRNNLSFHGFFCCPELESNFYSHSSAEVHDMHVMMKQCSLERAPHCAFFGFRMSAACHCWPWVIARWLDSEAVSDLSLPKEHISCTKIAEIGWG